VRQADVVARLGGDEFVVLLTDVPDRERVAAVAAKLIDVLSQPCIVRDQAVSVGASIGIAMYPGDASEVDALMTCADQAMYEAKRGGRSTYRFAD
jgi:diguanylate cyclase (GGDEF)-like protein